MTKPEPSDWPRRCGRCCGPVPGPGGVGAPWPGRLRLKKSRKNSSKGLPGGACGTSGASGRPGRACTAWVVEMLTTAGNSWRASGAKVSGARCATAGAAMGATARTAAKARAAKRTAGHLMGVVRGWSSRMWRPRWRAEAVIMQLIAPRRTMPRRAANHDPFSSQAIPTPSTAAIKPPIRSRCSGAWISTTSARRIISGATA